MNILFFSTLFPNCMQPNKAVYSRHKMAALNKFYDADVKIMAPVPAFPPIKQFPRWYIYSQIPLTEQIDNLEVSHPRYLVTPKIGMSFYGWWMFLSVLRSVKQLNKRFSIDLIDAHYVYPDGFAAVLLGKALNKPVVISALGTDINLFPQFPIIRSLIKYALQQTDHLISVCASLKTIMQDLGVPDKKITVIPNGIDPACFYRLNRSFARQKLQIQENTQVLITVGRLDENKGNHILIEALNQLNLKDQLNFFSYIIGGGEMYGFLADQIRRFGLDHQVKLVGEVNNKDLIYWYNAADLFFLGSQTEGMPNVLLEALACGLPVVSTPANGVLEIITSEKYGLLVERTAESYAQGLKQAFEIHWDRDQIYAAGQSRSWQAAAGEVYNVFQQVMETKRGERF